MDVAGAVLEAGGIAHVRTLRLVFSRDQLSAALRAGDVVRVGRGRYALPGIDEHRAAAASLNGSLDLLSAARHWGWKVKLPPERPQVIVPRGRNISAERRTGIDLRWGEVTPGQLADGVLSKERTALECARALPFDAAVAVVDSALRDGVSRTTLLLECARLPRKGRARAYEVIEFADKKAANPFESVLRASLKDVPGTHFEPQVWVGNVGRADLVDRARRVVVEADSFEFHSTPEALDRDMVRYNAFICEGYTVLRFGWKRAMFDQDYVRATVAGVLAAQERSVRLCPGCLAA